MSKLSVAILVSATMLPHVGFPQTLQEQISAVDTVMSQQEASEAATHAKEQKRFAAQRAAQNAARAKAQQRNQAHEDKLREMQVEDISLDLEAKRARVKRENDFIEQDLKERAARTDVIQSEADATRNVSSGVSDHLKSTGRAEETKAKKWF